MYMIRKSTRVLLVVGSCLFAAIWLRFFRTDTYPDCTFIVLDKETGNPVAEAYASAKWYKIVPSFEYATSLCGKQHVTTNSDGTFSIPATTCSGFRDFSTLEIDVKAPGYKFAPYRILLRSTKSRTLPAPIAHYLPLDRCAKGGQILELTRFESREEILEEQQDSYWLGKIKDVFVTGEDFNRMSEREWRMLPSEARQLKDDPTSLDRGNHNTKSRDDKKAEIRQKSMK